MSTNPTTTEVEQITTTTTTMDGRVPCPTCDQMFSTKRGVNIHHTRVHGESLVYETKTCENCDEAFKYQKTIYEHLPCERRFCSTACFSEGISGENHHLHGVVGDQHPRWNGGHVTDYGAFWSTVRELAIERDGAECQSCGLTREEHRSTYGRDIHVHHHIPLKEFPIPEAGHYLPNLATLCNTCHADVEAGRLVLLSDISLEQAS